jgi:drug/metabolite transporter (DMT)-like permease
MIVLLVVAIVTAGFVWWGFTASRKQRGIDRRHRAAFMGFSAALVALSATSLVLIVGAPHTHPSPAVAGFLGVTGIIATISILVTFFSGLFSIGGQRVALLSFCLVMLLIFMFNAAGHFGD